MLLRIVVDDQDGVARLQILGRLDDDGTEELRTAYEACVGKVQLDLLELRSVDAVGAAYLRGLVDAGVHVGRANPYVEALLRLGGSSGRGDRAAS